MGLESWQETVDKVLWRVFWFVFNPRGGHPFSMIGSKPVGVCLTDADGVEQVLFPASYDFLRCLMDTAEPFRGDLLLMSGRIESALYSWSSTVTDDLVRV